MLSSPLVTSAERSGCRGPDACRRLCRALSSGVWDAHGVDAPPHATRAGAGRDQSCSYGSKLNFTPQSARERDIIKRPSSLLLFPATNLFWRDVRVSSSFTQKGDALKQISVNIRTSAPPPPPYIGTPALLLFALIGAHTVRAAGGLASLSSRWLQMFN